MTLTTWPKPTEPRPDLEQLEEWLVESVGGYIGDPKYAWEEAESQARAFAEAKA